MGMVSGFGGGGGAGVGVIILTGPGLLLCDVLRGRLERPLAANSLAGSRWMPSHTPRPKLLTLGGADPAWMAAARLVNMLVM